MTDVVAVGEGVGDALATGGATVAVDDADGEAEATGAHDAGAGNCAKVTAALDLVDEAVVTAIVRTTQRAIMSAVDLRTCMVRPVMFVTLTAHRLRTLAILITHLLPGTALFQFK